MGNLFQGRKAKVESIHQYYAIVSGWKIDHKVINQNRYSLGLISVTSYLQLFVYYTFCVMA